MRGSVLDRHAVGAVEPFIVNVDKAEPIAVAASESDSEHSSWYDVDCGDGLSLGRQQLVYQDCDAARRAVVPGGDPAHMRRCVSVDGAHDRLVPRATLASIPGRAAAEGEAPGCPWPGPCVGGDGGACVPRHRSDRLHREGHSKPRCRGRRLVVGVAAAVRWGWCRIPSSRRPPTVLRARGRAPLRTTRPSPRKVLWLSESMTNA